MTPEQLINVNELKLVKIVTGGGCPVVYMLSMKEMNRLSH